MARIVRPLLILAAVLASYGAGVASSDAVRATAHLVAGEKQVECIDRGAICVGASAPRAFLYMDRDKHGLTAVFCDDNRPNDKFFLDAVVAGRTCEGPYHVELRSPTTRTRIKVRDGKIVQIRQGPLHIIDL
jgi:hypothetical protein